jgi:hypothetical protein
MWKSIFFSLVALTLVLTTILQQPSVSTAQNTSAVLVATVTVAGETQRDDLWTTGSTTCNQWAKPMYYIWFDDNGNPNDGGYGNGQGPVSAIVNLDTGQLGFKMSGEDRQWGTQDDIVYWPIAETSPGSGKWSHESGQV